MKSLIVPFKAVLLVAATLTLLPVIAAPTHTPHKTALQPHITLKQARDIALKVFPGKIIKSELEHEKGGSGLRYSFDIQHGKLIHEVGVDAETGKLLENSDDSNDSD